MKKPPNHKKKWTKTQEIELREMIKKEMTTREMAKKLGRTEQAVRSKADRLEESVKPKDK